MLSFRDVAPDFSVGDTSLYRMLEDRAAVVFFFPKAFTPGCTREARGFRQEYEGLRSSDCDVVGVSGDTQETSDRFRTSLELPFPLVGDPDGVILRSYRVRWPVIGLSRRVTYLVARDRRVRLAFHDEFRMKAHVDAACAELVRAADGD